MWASASGQLECIWQSLQSRKRYKVNGEVLAMRFVSHLGISRGRVRVVQGS